MFKNEVDEEYFNYLYDLVCRGVLSKNISYRNLLLFLHDTEFTYSIPRDGNRASDGLDLREMFSRDVYYGDIPSDASRDYPPDEEDYLVQYIDRPCSVLEMIIALALKCETDIMGDPRFGDRTIQWFWGMLKNMGLGAMNDSNFDLNKVDFIVTRFLNREYEPNGKGGLFTVKHCDKDLRDIEIWYQLNWYLEDIA